MFLEFIINRKKVFESTYNIFRELPPVHLSQRYFQVQFEEEDGVDGGYFIYDYFKYYVFFKKILKLF